MSYVGPNTFTFAVSGTPPAYWLLYQSTDGGVTWALVDNEPYGSPSNPFGVMPGNQFYGVASPDGVTPVGPDSNIITT